MERLNSKNGSRPLTSGEIELARSVFGEAIDYSTVRLVKGRAQVVARRSPNALYDEALAGFGESGGLFSQQSSPGFIELWTLQSRMAHGIRNRKDG